MFTDVLHTFQILVVKRLHSVIVLKMPYSITNSFIAVVCTFGKKHGGYVRVNSILSPGIQTLSSW